MSEIDLQRVAHSLDEGVLGRRRNRTEQHVAELLAHEIAFRKMAMASKMEVASSSTSSTIEVDQLDEEVENLKVERKELAERISAGQKLNVVQQRHARELTERIATGELLLSHLRTRGFVPRRLQRISVEKRAVPTFRAMQKPAGPECSCGIHHRQCVCGRLDVDCAHLKGCGVLN